MKHILHNLSQTNGLAEQSTHFVVFSVTKFQDMVSVPTEQKKTPAPSSFEHSFLTPVAFGIAHQNRYK